MVTNNVAELEASTPLTAAPSGGTVGGMMADDNISKVLRLNMVAIGSFVPLRVDACEYKF